MHFLISAKESIEKRWKNNYYRMNKIIQTIKKYLEWLGS